MTCPNTPPETPGPKDEILETPLVVNVPTTSMTNSPKKKKVSLWSRFVNKVTPEVGRCRTLLLNHKLTSSQINSLKRLDGKPHGPRAVEAAASESNKAKQAKKGKEEEVVDPRTDSANVVVVASGSKNSDVSSSIVVGEASSSRVSDTGCSVKETEASKESVEPREF